MSDRPSPFATLATINDLAWTLYNSNPANPKKRNMQPKEISLLLNNFKNEDVKFILIGGFAMAFYGFPRATGDIDLWIKNTEENMLKLREALIKTGFQEASALRLTTRLVPGMTILNVLETDFKIDLLHNLKMFEEKHFDVCYRRADNGDHQGVKIKVLSATDMLDEKKLVNMEKDAQDISYLTNMIKKIKDSLSM